MWCRDKRIPPLPNAHAQQLHTRAHTHMGTGHTLPRTMTMEGSYSPVKGPPTPTIHNSLDSGQGQAQCSPWRGGGRGGGGSL